jgi:3-dehydroquinate synthase
MLIPQRIFTIKLGKQGTSRNTRREIKSPKISFIQIGKIMQITVELGSRSYQVILTNDAPESFPAQVRKLFPNSRIALVTNATMADLYGSIISLWKNELSLDVFAIPDGEKFKTVETWNSVVGFLLKSKLDRKSVVVALGGGVVGDIVGFAASAFLRGISCVQVPTTLLAMVDSSVGGKTGVNHPLGKNLIGAFHQPSLVWMDAAFLKTLPEREFIAGFAELFKYAFIGEREMFDFIAKNTNSMLAKQQDVLLEGIKRSVEIKAGVVASDERETLGKRALLNFGHTFAHAVERFYNFEQVLHGEAVLFGIRCACDLALRMGSIPKASEPEYTAMLAAAPAIHLPSKPHAQMLYDAMFTDKKIEAGKLAFVLPGVPGSATLVRDIPEKLVRETLFRAVETF